MISAADETMIELFSGLTARQFAKLVRQLRSEGADPALKGRKVLRDCRLRGTGSAEAMAGIARLYNLTLAG